MTHTDTHSYDTVIVGLGMTGLSCARYLHQRTLGRTPGRCAVVDSRRQPPQLAALQASCPEVPVYLGSLERELICKARQLIISPGVSRAEPVIQEALAAGVPICGDVELFRRQVRAPVIAVTGSNGKSTVVTLLGEMIREAGLKAGLGGNIGTPVLDLLGAPEPDFYVLELSSFQLESVQSLNAAVALILNISADHLDRYPDMESYIRAKLAVYAGADRLVFNRDDPLSMARHPADRPCISYGLDLDIGIDMDVGAAADSFGVMRKEGQRFLARGETPLLPLRDLRLRGEHNVANALAALALGTAIQLPLAAMLRALRQFGGLPHRCQWLGRFQGIDWYNDSKATNVGASCAAIKGLAGAAGLVLIAGGNSKGADFTPLADCMQGRVRALILLGRDAGRLAAARPADMPVYFATDMAAAVGLAARLASSGERVLLSPACASQDMFADYRARGASYVAAIRALAAQAGEP